MVDAFIQKVGRYALGSLVMPYFILLSHICYNIIQYVYRQSKYKEFHIAFFYTVALATITLRLIAYSYMTFNFGENYSVFVSSMICLPAFLTSSLII